jgi:uncharacterized phage protein (TIGR02218 family)
MSRVFFREELEPTATFWRVFRRDGITLGFTGHNRDLWLDGVLHRAAPGMLPSAVRRTADLGADSVDVEGVLSHDAISSADLAAGLFDRAQVRLGVVDWETGERAILYHGEIGAIGEEATGFSAELLSAKAQLEIDPVPRTSPTCRARFCGPGCTLSAARFTHELRIAAVDLVANAVSFVAGPSAESFRDGALHWIDGPQAGRTNAVVDVTDGMLVLAQSLDPTLAPGTLARLTEGCDHTIATCRGRFANAINFQGEPFLPGNDLLTHYPSGAA